MTTDQKNTILIVDDEPNNLDVLDRCLCEAGFDVLVAENGETALKRVSYVKPDLVLLDVKMPGMDGFETCRRLKEHEATQDVPIIFLTVATETVDKVKGLEMSAMDYITKPFQPEEVVARVKKHLTIRNLQRQLEEQNTQLQAALREREVLLQEILHRTKNNMAAICSILSLQSARIEDEQTVRMFEDIKSRVQSMLLVQQKLYESEDFANLDLREYVMDLAYTVFSNLSVEIDNVSLRFDLESVSVSPDTAIPCGLLLNELLTNALKYAFPGDRTGEISITLHTSHEGEIELGVRDNGVGLPKDLDVGKTDSLGLQLVLSFVDQLLGTIEIKREQGAEFLIRFKEPEYKQG